MTKKTETEKTELVFEKQIDKYGIKTVILKEIHNVLAYEELPAEYVAKGKMFYVSSDNKDMLCIFGLPYNLEAIWEVGEPIDVDQFEVWLPVLKEASERLKKINKKVRKREKEWKGEFTIKI